MRNLFTDFWLPLVLNDKLKMDKLLEMMKDFNKALSKFQAEQDAVERSRKGVHGSKYASWPDLREKTKEKLNKQKLTLIQYPYGDPSSPQWVTVLKHENGYMEEYISPMGNNTKPLSAQEFGGFITYMKRYTYTSILGIADPNEEDTDKQAYLKEQQNLHQQDAPLCPKCNSIMTYIPKGKNGPWWGCSQFKITGCTGSRSI